MIVTYIYVVGQSKIRLGEFDKFLDWPNNFQANLRLAYDIYTHTNL